MLNSVDGIVKHAREAGQKHPVQISIFLKTQPSIATENKNVIMHWIIKIWLMILAQIFTNTRGCNMNAKVCT
jgi:hypothetical protein